MISGVWTSSFISCDPVISLFVRFNTLCVKLCCKHTVIENNDTGRVSGAETELHYTTMICPEAKKLLFLNFFIPSDVILHIFFISQFLLNWNNACIIKWNPPRSLNLFLNDCSPTGPQRHYFGLCNYTLTPSHSILNAVKWFFKILCLTIVCRVQ